MSAGTIVDMKCAAQFDNTAAVRHCRKDFPWPRRKHSKILLQEVSGRDKEQGS